MTHSLRGREPVLSVGFASNAAAISADKFNMNIPKTTVQLGSRGKLVRDLQQELQAAGFDPKGVDGVFGANTQAALEAYQRSQGLKTDGVAGKDTWTALGGDRFEPAPAPSPTPSPARPGDSWRGITQVPGVTPEQEAWFTTALDKLGLPRNLRIPLEVMAFGESSMDPNVPNNRTLRGLMQQDVGQLTSMWNTFPELRPQGMTLTQAMHDPVFQIMTACKYIQSELPGYGGYHGFENLWARTNRGPGQILRHWLATGEFNLRLYHGY